MRRSHQRLEAPEYYVPGLSVDYVAQRYGIPIGDIAKLGSAENPYGASPLAKEAITEHIDALHLYPSWTADSLRENMVLIPPK